MNDNTRLELLADSILQKVNKNPLAHDAIFSQIEKEIVDSINNWLVISKPTNCITAETKDFIEALKQSIYLTIKDHDKNNWNSKESSTSKLH